MDYAKYSDLKSKSKLSFKKIAASGEIPEYVVLETKQYDPNTGEALTDSSKKISLEDLENTKAMHIADKAKIDAQLVEIGKMITDIKAL
tara:strand:+ start:61 stop:327 length:267 start_codon:yes stop_codon:yes gene_type:complete